MKKPEIVSVTLPPRMAGRQMPDEHACAMALPYALHEGIETIEVQGVGEVHSRRYAVSYVLEYVRRHPELRALGGMGHPEPRPGVVQVGGGHVFLGRQTSTPGGLLRAR